MKCQRCGNDIEDGKQVVLWGPSGRPATVSFLCEKCGNAPEFRDITEEVIGVRP